jgi:2-keto-3-deoxy-6-phosphogluconate aldolase
MQEFFEVLRRMGRNVADCAICLSPMDPADQSQPIQALGCTHAFHQACVQAHVWRRANDRGGSVCPACRTPMELMSESESRSYVHPKV